LLHRIGNFSDSIPKRKHYDLDELNELFGTNYKKISDIERKILIPVKSELDIYSKISFVYEMNFDLLGAGRPKAIDITIDVIDNSNNLFSN